MTYILTSNPSTAELFCDVLEPGAKQVIQYAGNCTVTVGCNVIYDCEDQYELKGDSVRTCTATQNGAVWSGPAPYCISKDTYIELLFYCCDYNFLPNIPVSNLLNYHALLTGTVFFCDSLKPGTNQIINYAGNCMAAVGCRAVYTCEDNNEIGDTVRTCTLTVTETQNEIAWSGTAPTCEQTQSKNIYFY